MLNECNQSELIERKSLESCYNNTSSKFYSSDRLANKDYTSDGVHFPTDVAPIEKGIKICTTIIGCLGLIANITAIVILLKVKSGRLFNRDVSGQNQTQTIFQWIQATVTWSQNFLTWNKNQKPKTLQEG